MRMRRPTSDSESETLEYTAPSPAPAAIDEEDLLDSGLLVAVLTDGGDDKGDDPDNAMLALAVAADIAKRGAEQVQNSLDLFAEAKKSRRRKLPGVR